MVEKSLFRRFWLGFRISLLLLVAAICLVKEVAAQAEVDIDIDIEYPRRVAILPFVNETQNPEAATLMRRLFFNFFSSLNYRDIEMPEIDGPLERAGLMAAVTAGELPIRKICHAVDADAIITAKVKVFGRLYAVIYSHRQVTLEAEMIHCQGGELLWKNKHEVVERDAVIASGLAGIGIGIIKSLATHQSVPIITAATQVSMEIVDTIPNPTKIAERGPRIRQMVHNGAGRYLKSGEELRIVLLGEPGHKAKWDVSPAISGLPMEERKPGIYVGSYVIGANDRAADVQLTGRLISKTGTTSRWTDITGVNFGAGTTLPLKIQQDMSLNAADGPFFVNELLLVPAGVELTVNAGSVIWVARGGIVVRGGLKILGTEDEPVRIYGSSTKNWKGLMVDRAQEPVSIRNASIENAGFGIKVRGSTILLENAKFLRNTWGVVVDGGDFEMKSGSIEYSAKIGFSAKNARLKVSDVRIFENNEGGMQIQSSDVAFKGNDVYANGRWEASNLDSDKELKLPGNWWGDEEIAKVRLKGKVVIEPALTSSSTYSLRKPDS